MRGACLATNVARCWQPTFVRWQAVRIRASANFSVEQTGQSVEPLQVRLRPKTYDLYQWDILNPECEQLFERNLSEHRITSLRVILSQVGIGFRGVRQAAVARCASPSDALPSAASNWAVADVAKLQEDLVHAEAVNEQLQEEVRVLNSRIATQEAKEFELSFIIDKFVGDYRDASQQYASDLMA